MKAVNKIFKNRFLNKSFKVRYKHIFTKYILYYQQNILCKYNIDKINYLICNAYYNELYNNYNIYYLNKHGKVHKYYKDKENRKPAVIKYSISNNETFRSIQFEFFKNGNCTDSSYIVFNEEIKYFKINKKYIIN
jgi:hypothetical protein